MPRLFAAAMAAFSLFFSFTPAQAACAPGLVKLARSHTVQVIGIDAHNHQLSNPGVRLTSSLVLTVYHLKEARHVVYSHTGYHRSQTYLVHTAKGQVSATVVAEDAGRDLLLLQLHRPLEPSIDILTLAENPSVGQEFQLWSSYQGNVPRGGKVTSILGPLLRLQNAAVWGDSGTPLFTCRGELLGIFNEIPPPAEMSTAAYLKMREKLNGVANSAERLRQMNWLKLSGAAAGPPALRNFLCANAPHAVRGCAPPFLDLPWPSYR